MEKFTSSLDRVKKVLSFFSAPGWKDETWIQFVLVTKPENIDPEGSCAVLA